MKNAMVRNKMCFRNKKAGIKPAFIFDYMF